MDFGEPYPYSDLSYVRLLDATYAASAYAEGDRRVIDNYTRTAFVGMRRVKLNGQIVSRVEELGLQKVKSGDGAAAGADADRADDIEVAAADAHRPSAASLFLPLFSPASAFLVEWL